MIARCQNAQCINGRVLEPVKSATNTGTGGAGLWLWVQCPNCKGATAATAWVDVKRAGVIVLGPAQLVGATAPVKL